MGILNATDLYDQNSESADADKENIESEDAEPEDTEIDDNASLPADDSDDTE